MSAKVVINRQPMYSPQGTIGIDGKKTKDKLPYLCIGKCSIMNHYVGATACQQCVWYVATVDNSVICDNPIIADHKKMGLRV